jgi:flagellar basal body-associated protein FliL
MPFEEEAEENGKGRAKKRFHLVMVVLVVNALAVGVLVWFYLDLRGDQARARCEGIVSGRESGRAMWVRTADRIDEANPEPNDFVIQMRKDLDELLPRLQCVNNVAVPITEPE